MSQEKVLATRRTAFRFAFLLGFLLSAELILVSASAQTRTPVFVNVATQGHANIWAVGQDVILLTTVPASGSSLNPSGTVQFYANGQPAGPPATLIPAGNGVQGNGYGSVTVPFSTPGNYTLTATYSGDANFAPGASTVSLPFTVEASPPTIVPKFSATSLTFKAGAAAGNMVSVALTAVNGWRGALQCTTSIAPAAGTSAPAIPATVTTTFAPPDANGNTVEDVVIYSTAPPIVTVRQAEPLQDLLGGTPLIATAAILFFVLPLGARRAPRVIVVVLASVLFMSGLGGCGSQSSATSSRITEVGQGSAGAYYLTVYGETTLSIGESAGSPGDVTYFFAQIPVSIQ